MSSAEWGSLRASDNEQEAVRRAAQEILDRSKHSVKASTARRFGDSVMRFEGDGDGAVKVEHIVDGKVINNGVASSNHTKVDIDL